METKLENQLVCSYCKSNNISIPPIGELKQHTCFDCKKEFTELNVSNWLVDKIRELANKGGATKDELNRIADELLSSPKDKAVGQREGEVAVKFAEWINNIGFQKYKEGWCQSGGSNGWHCTSEELFQTFLKETNLTQSEQPVSLPTDEEIEDKGTNSYEGILIINAYIDGAKWMREQLTGKQTKT